MREPGSTRVDTSRQMSQRAINERIARMGRGGVSGWGGNPIAEREYRSTINSFNGSVEYTKTDNLDYMTKVANDALQHFGFDGNARMTISKYHPAFTDYTLLIDKDNAVSSYRQYGSDSRRIGANLEGMVEDALIYKIAKRSGQNTANSLTDAVGHIRGMRWKWIGE